MRKTTSKLFGPDENGDFYEYFEVYCDSSEDKPTHLIADGSNVICTDNGNWDFFNEKSQTWNTMLNIQG